MKCDLASRVGKGDRVAITAGSRGIAQIAETLRSVVREVRRVGGKPFLVPAMGSHGGATACGQKALLESLGITESSMDAPIKATMQVEQVATTTQGLPTYMDKFAAAADGIIVVNRIKQHTDFSAPVESGLSKMIAVGLGKQRGAETVHNQGTHGLRQVMPQIAGAALTDTRILMGLAILENGYHEVADIIGMLPQEVPSGETRLLKKVRHTAPRIPFSPIDVLIIDRIGKDISGTGIDTRVIGRLRLPPDPEFKRPQVKVVVALDLTDASHGNGVGVGLADFVTKQLVDKIDWEVTRTNVVTAGFYERSKVPFVMPTVEDAILAAVGAARVHPAKDVRMVRIKDTIHLDEMEISLALLNEASRIPTIEILPTSPL